MNGQRAPSISAGEDRRPGGGDVPLLSLSGIVAGYGSGDMVLKGTTFDVPQGSITCVIGPNGAGKSTVGRVVSGLIRARQGRMVFDGQEITRLTPRDILRHGIVQVPQEHSLFGKMTVRENVEFGGFMSRNRAEVARRYEEIADQFPIVRDRASERAASLSGGQQRLIEFARSLMMSPRLIVLDEPSLGLDPGMVRTVFKMVRDMNASGITVLLIEQNARAALRMSSHGLVLESGRVRLTGSGKEILENPEVGQLFLGGAMVQSKS